MDNRGKERKYISTAAPRRSAISGPVVYSLNLPIVSFLLERCCPEFWRSCSQISTKHRSSREGLDYNGCYNALPMIHIRADDLISPIGSVASRQASAVSYALELPLLRRVTWSLPYSCPPKGSSIQQLVESGKDYPSPLS